MESETAASDRLVQQLSFIVEIDKLKGVLRRSQLINEERYEDSAEHSWHIALMAVVLAEHANEPVDLLRVVKMLLIHDIVEIDAGDTYAYDEGGKQSQQVREQAAAARIFGLLPKDQAGEFKALFDEFDERETPESRYANAVDRLMPLMHNVHSNGVEWRKHDITQAQVFQRIKPVDDGSAALWGIAESLIDDSVDKGYLRDA